ncbi:hypothetical protein NQD34_004051 [Periophthalmus magnuspinnatus]|nr:hypothetical protein NQD34_004051 [Periophthalmus magnuspinnatus]
MAAAVGSEDNFLCSICLDLFNSPVTTPCGHNFCKTCITTHWDLNPPVCPLCKNRFKSRPHLKTNTLVSEMVAKIRSLREAQAGPEDVPCDVCPKPRLKALKSCLNCVASYCQSHLEPHQAVPGLKNHELIGPVQNLMDRVCSKHGQPLKQFCQTDQSYICRVCSLLEHKNHTNVSLKDLCDRKKSSLQLSQTKTQDWMEKRKQKIKEIWHHMKLSQRVYEEELAAGQQAFTALIETVQSRQKQFIEQLLKKHKQTARQAKDRVQQLKQEISELEKRSSELEKRLCCEDYFYFLQNFTALPPIEVKNWSSGSFEVETCKDIALQALSELKEQINAQINRNVFKRVQTFAVDITLDPSTANPNLTLSGDLKQVHHTDKKNNYPDTAQRFSDCPGVLGKQSFSSGKFYFEVEVRDKTEWDIGVALKSVRRENPTLHPHRGFWTICLRGGKHYACTGDCLFLRAAPKKVGVFVNYHSGLVDFYDVHTADLIHSFTGCNFSQSLLPFFSPSNNHRGTNSTPLVVTGVKDECSPPKKLKQ